MQGDDGRPDFGRSLEAMAPWVGAGVTVMGNALVSWVRSPDEVDDFVPAAVPRFQAAAG